MCSCVQALTECERHEAGAELLTVKIKVNGALLLKSAGTIKVFSLLGGIDENIREQNTWHHAEEMLQQTPANAVPPVFG